MKTRACLAIAAAAGLTSAAQAQETCTITFGWTEVIAATNAAVTGSNLNGRLDTGEGARIFATLNYTVNGLPGMGKTVSVPVGTPPPSVGTNLGFGGFYFDLASTGGDATGAWNARATAAGFNTGATTGTILGGGAGVQGWGAGQSISPGYTHGPNPDQYIPNLPVSTNPVNNSIRGTWIPASYASRTIHWSLLGGSNVPSGQSVSVMTGWHTHTDTNVFDGGPDNGGIDLNDPANGGATNTVTFYDNFFTKYPNVVFTNNVGTLDIPIGAVPTPSSVALLGLGALVAGRRRR